jgi:hypothetical protein
MALRISYGLATWVVLRAFVAAYGAILVLIWHSFSFI